MPVWQSKNSERTAWLSYDRNLSVLIRACFITRTYTRRHVHISMVRENVHISIKVRLDVRKGQAISYNMQNLFSSWTG